MDEPIETELTEFEQGFLACHFFLAGVRDVPTIEQFTAAVQALADWQAAQRTN